MSFSVIEKCSSGAKKSFTGTSQVVEAKALSQSPARTPLPASSASVADGDEGITTVLPHNSLSQVFQLLGINHAATSSFTDTTASTVGQRQLSVQCQAVPRIFARAHGILLIAL
jgi:hypothetical protein